MEGRSPDYASVGCGRKISMRSPSSIFSIRKDFLRKFIDSEMLTESLEDWITAQSSLRKPAFDVPFELPELQSMDYALEGVPFQQLVRMPNALRASPSDAVEATAHLAIEDFLYAALKGLWERFWGHDTAKMPFYVASIHSSSSKFYTAEKAIASGKLGGLCAAAIMLKNGENSPAKWDQIVELALLRPDITILPMPMDEEPPHFALGEALFFAVRVLVSRSFSRSATAFQNANHVFVLLVDSQCGGVVKVEGDINKLDFHGYNVYESAAEWIKMHAKISVSSVDGIWNKLGNANWGDIGTLRILLTTFHSMVQFLGIPRHSLEELAREHGSRLQMRRDERHLVDAEANGNGIIPFQRRTMATEIVEEDESTRTIPEEKLNLEKGSVIYLEESNLRRAFRINGKLIDNQSSIYCASLVDEPAKLLILYVGSCPLHMDLNLWYQVQRQTKMLSLMRQRGLSNKNLPQVAASGRVIHPGQCQKPSAHENCSHPWCGTPILVTYPYGETVSYMVRNGLFGPDEALKCCHDCLSAIAAASLVGIRHGDISPENVICVTSGVRRPFFVLIGWGRAVLEERDRPAMNLRFSSTSALQEGKLCAASDTESLVYLLYFSCGGVFPDMDSFEGALKWRKMVWSRRVIHHKLGDISAVLKAFADYVDSLCGTHYPIDYNIWLRRLRKSIDEEDHGKQVDLSN